MKPLFIFIALLLAGCSPQKPKGPQSGPLSKITEFQVVPVFAPNTTSDQEMLVNHLVELLQKIGTVNVTTTCLSETSASCAGIVISVSELETSKRGSITVLAEGEIAVNKYKASCEAWSARFWDPTLPYPVDTEKGISFERDPTAVNPDMKTVITQMVEQFADQYRKDNPNSKPTFHIYGNF